MLGSILVTSIGSLAGYSTIASLKAMPGTHVIGCDIHPYEWLSNATEVTYFMQVASAATDPKAYLDNINALCENYIVENLLPLTDVEVDLLSEQSHSLPSRVTSCMSDIASVLVMRDKLAWSVLFKDAGINVGIPTMSLADVHSTTIPFPCVAKPRRGRSKQGFTILAGPRDLDYLRSSVHVTDFIIQPLVGSDVFVVDVIRDGRSGKIVTVCRRELLRSANGAGMVVEMYPDPKLDRASRMIAQALNVNGCVNLEFLAKDGCYLLMDVNPRLSAGIGFSHAAGYDMVRNHVRLFRGQQIDDQIAYKRTIFSRAIGRVEATETLPPSAQRLHTFDDENVSIAPPHLMDATS